MLRSIDGGGEANGVYSNGKRYGFSFQEEDEYTYKTLSKIYGNLYVAENEDRRWGIVDSQNQTKLPFEFALIRRYVHGDLFVVTWEGKMGVLTLDLKPRYALVYEDLLCFKTDSCLAKRDGLWGVVNSGDEEIVPIKYIDIDYNNDNTYRVKTRMGWGVVGVNSEEIVPAQYSSIPVSRLPGFQLGVEDDGFDLYEMATGNVTRLNIDKADIDRGYWSGIVSKNGKYGIVAVNQVQPEMIFDEVRHLGYGGAMKGKMYIVGQDNRYGLYNAATGMVTEIIYDAIQHYSYTGGRFLALLETNGTSTIIDFLGNIVVPSTNDHLYEVVNRYWVTENDQGVITRIINIDGEELLTGPFLDLKVEYGISNILQCRNKDGWQLYDARAKKNIGEDFREVKLFDKRHLVARDEKGWKLVVSEKKMSEIPSQDELLVLTTDRFALREQNWALLRSAQRTYTPAGELEMRIGLIDLNGQQILPNEYHRIRLQRDSTLTVVKNMVGRKFDLRTLTFRDTTFESYNKSSNYKTDPKYTVTASTMAKGPRATAIPEIGATTLISKTPFHFTKSGWKLTSPHTESAQLPDGITALSEQVGKVMFKGGLYAIWRGDKIGAINKAGEIIIPAEYDDLVGANQGHSSPLVYSYGEKKGKYCLINSRGKQITPAKYDEIRAFQDGMARVRIKNKWGFINLYGEEKIPLKYDSVLPFVHGASRAVKAGKQMFINKDNNCEWGCN